MSTYLTLLYIKTDKINLSKPIEAQWSVSPLTDDFQCTAVVREVMPECTVETDEGTVGEIVLSLNEASLVTLENIIKRCENWLARSRNSSSSTIEHLLAILLTTQVLARTGYLVALRYA